MANKRNPGRIAKNPRGDFFGAADAAGMERKRRRRAGNQPPAVKIEVLKQLLRSIS